MPRPGQLALVLLLAAASLPAAAGAQQPPEACSRHTELDFWIGHWRVLAQDGSELGTDRVERLLGGCVLLERWQSRRGGSGLGFHYFDPALGRWRQEWVDGRGGVAHAVARLTGGRVEFDGETVRADGMSLRSRAVLEPLADGRLRHRIEHSADGGATWTLYFDGLYERLDTAAATTPTAPTAAAPDTAAPPPPSAPAPPAPAPAPAPEPRTTTQRPEAGSGVTAVSDEAAAEIPAEELPQTRMESPMTLEVELGPLHLLPAGQAWYTTETEAFVCNAATLKRIEASSSARRGRQQIRLAFSIHTSRSRKRVDLAVELRAAGRTVATTRLDKLAVGRLTTNWDKRMGVEVEGQLELAEGESLEQLFAGDAAPTLRLTLTVP